MNVLIRQDYGNCNLIETKMKGKLTNSRRVLRTDDVFISDVPTIDQVKIKTRK